MRDTGFGFFGLLIGAALVFGALWFFGMVVSPSSKTTPTPPAIPKVGEHKPFSFPERDKLIKDAEEKKRLEEARVKP